MLEGHPLSTVRNCFFNILALHYINGELLKILTLTQHIISPINIACPDHNVSTHHLCRLNYTKKKRCVLKKTLSASQSNIIPKYIKKCFHSYFITFYQKWSYPPARNTNTRGQCTYGVTIWSIRTNTVAMTTQMYVPFSLLTSLSIM